MEESGCIVLGMHFSRFDRCIPPLLILTGVLDICDDFLLHKYRFFDCDFGLVKLRDTFSNVVAQSLRISIQ